MTKGHKISRVLPGSIAEEMGVEPGMSLISINGTVVEDVFDYRFLMDDEEVNILIREENGEETLLEVEKDADEEFGVEFENSLMDSYHSCSNRCIFCFIDQMPGGMRDTLYFKDDDSRLSFLQGNYVTLTNMRDHDIERIIRYRMEPINVSVHTTNPELRVRMLGNRFAGRALEKMRRLAEAGIIMNGQIVLCKGWNDGEELDRTIRDLAEMRPAMQSVSIVPVGLTKYREKLCPLEPFTAGDAAALIDQVEAWQDRLAAAGADLPSPHFIHASDEWYILAGRPMPVEERYDGFPQLENGVGMVRLLENEIKEALEAGLRMPAARRRVTIATGVLISDYIRRFADLVMETYPGLAVRVVPIRNDFFGHMITVSGLITGRDLIAQLDAVRAESEDPDGALGEAVLIPVNMLRMGETVFLDDLTTADVEEKLGVPVEVVWTSGENFVRGLLGLPHTELDDRQMYESWE